MRTKPPSAEKLAPFLADDEPVRQVFMACEFNYTMRDGGSTRIVAVTDRSIVVLIGGLINRTIPQRVADRRRPVELRDPDVVWPGTSPYGEEWGEIMPGLWAHVRYRGQVEKARKRIEWLYS